MHSPAGCFGVINLEVQATYHTVAYQGVVSDSFIRAPDLDIYILFIRYLKYSSREHGNAFRANPQEGYLKLWED